MKLGGQGEGGYAMATLLVAMALMAIFMSVALPAWSQMAQREKETEYLFRANQYALAVARCRLKQCGANGPAPSVDFLVEQRFLRKKYKDPLTGKDFVPVLRNQAIPPGGAAGGVGPNGQQGRPGQPGQPGQPQQTERPSALATAPKSLATDTLNVTASTPGGMDGAAPLTAVTSSSKETALRLFKGQATTYDQWAVSVDDVNLHLGGRSIGSRFAQTQVGQGANPNQGPGSQGQPPFGQSPFGQPQGQSPFGRPQGNTGFGTPQGTGGSGFGQPNQQGTSIFPQPPPAGGQGTAPPPPAPASPFGRKPPL